MTVNEWRIMVLAYGLFAGGAVVLLWWILTIVQDRNKW